MERGPRNQELLALGGVDAVFLSIANISDMDSLKVFISSCNLVTAGSVTWGMGVETAARMTGSIDSGISEKLTFHATFVTGFPQPARDFLS